MPKVQDKPTTVVAVYTGASGFSPSGEPKSVRDAADAQAGR